MISYTLKCEAKHHEILEVDSITSNEGWIFRFELHELKCMPVNALKVYQYEIEVRELVTSFNFGKIVFQVGSDSYQNSEAVGRNVFYGLVCNLGYDLNEYTIADKIYMKGLRDFIEDKLLPISIEPQFGTYSKPIIEIKDKEKKWQNPLKNL